MEEVSDIKEADLSILTVEEHEPADESEHTGTKVISGNKWIATKWVHSRPFT
jgi:hypothetical protein